MCTYKLHYKKFRSWARATEKLGVRVLSVFVERISEETNPERVCGRGE